MPLCRIDYDRSEIRDFTSEADKDHQYLSLVFVPKKMSILTQANLGTRGASFQMNFYPQRDSSNTIDADFEKLMLDAFENKELEDELVDHVSVEIPPTIMTYQSDSKTHQAGDMIMEGKYPRIYTSIKLTCLMKKGKDGVEEPIQSMNELKTRAIAIRDYRLKQQQWLEPTEAELNRVEDPEPEPDPTIVVNEPAQTPPHQQQNNGQRRK